MFEKLGLQLYTVRDYLSDPSLADYTFARLAEMGYTEGQTAGNAFDAKLFGELLSDIMRFGLPASDGRIAAAAGLAIGKWIYVADALDDLEEDEQRARYNPFLLLFGHVPDENEREGIQNALKNQLYDADAAIDLIEFEHDAVQSIIKNILYLGLPNRIEEICKKSEQKRNQKGCKKK